MKKHATRRNHVVISLVLLTFCATSFAGRIIYVKQGGTGDGSSWADANGILQQAINAASAGDQVWVAKGTYKPTVEVGGSGDRYKTFQMKNAVAIYGGFAGNEPNTFDINDRDLIAYETILSGDLLGNDTPGLDPCDLLDDPNRADNCYHIFYHPDGLALDPNATLNGFTFTAGNANAGDTYPHNAGSGMFNRSGSPTVTNCTFTGNSADYFGGGMHNEFFSSPTVSNCTFSGNSAGERGGGIYNNDSSSSPTVTNCTFTGNSAGGSGGWGDNGGGGMFNRSGSPTVTNCTFSGNSAGYFGGGMYNSDSNSLTVTNCTFTVNSADLGGGMFNNDSSPTVTNCTFSGNSAGGMFNYLNSNPTVTNCAFSGNSADYEGGGMYNDGSHTTVANCTFSGNTADWGGGMYNYYSSSPTVSNCILWDNTATSDGNEIYNDPNISHPANPLISYCDIAGSGGSTSWDPNLGTDAGGNIDVDPLFVDANGPDGIAGTADDNLRLLWGSPCIDAGNDANVYTDIEGNIRPFDFPGVDNNGELPEFDMGAYEATAQITELMILPRVINRHSRQRRILARLCLPEGITRNQIDRDTPLVLYPGNIEAIRQFVFQNRNGASIFAFFDKADLLAAIPENGRTDLEVTGRLTTGQIFYGTDSIRIIDPKMIDFQWQMRRQQHHLPAPPHRRELKKEKRL
ncbi:MAG: right-handed parallel beta-helix repeat-containing protein [Planctomycetota bacterium]